MQQTTTCSGEESGAASSARARTLGRVFWLATYAYTSLLLVHAFITFTGLTLSAFGGFQPMIDGSAHRPYISRALVPMVIRGISSATPNAMKHAVLQVLGSRGFIPEFYLRGYSYEKVVFLCIAWAFFLATAYMFKALARQFYCLSENTAGVVGVAGLMLVPLLFRYFTYVYDPATIFFATLMLLLAARHKAAFFFLAFTLACVNKETAILGMPVFAIFYWREYPRRMTAAASAGLTAIWVAVRTALKYRYAGSPGADLEIHFWDHTAHVVTRYPMSLAFAITVMGVLIGVAMWGWRDKPRELNIACLATLLPLIVSAVAFGFPEETRVYYEAYPYLLLLGVPTVLSIQGAKSQREPMPPELTLRRDPVEVER